ncbi:hypothetical protein BG618_05119 [Pseudonocardia autotrophica]|nr:hypothetical protein BG618_05119 [Pseudonocardia autotrophica]
MVLHSPGCGRVGRRRHSTSWDVPRTVESGAFLISGLFSVRCVMPARPGISVSVLVPGAGPSGPVVGAVELSRGSRIRSCRAGGVGAPRMPSCDLAPSAGAARSQERVRRGAPGASYEEARSSERGVGPVPPRESLCRRERTRWRRGVRPGCAHPRSVRGGRRLREMAHGGPESVVCIARPVGRCRTRPSGAVPGSWRSHGSATAAAPLASVTSTAGGLRRTVPGLPADRRTPDAVRSGVRVRSARERKGAGRAMVSAPIRRRGPSGPCLRPSGDR